MGRSLAVLGPVLAAPGVFLFGCGGAGGDPADVSQKNTSTTEVVTEATTETIETSSEPTTAPTTKTTTSMGKKLCGQSSVRTLTTSLVDDAQCQPSVYNENSRPAAEYCDTMAQSTEDCCADCQTDENCDAWVFNTMLKLCSLVMKDATWAGVIEANDWTFGAKMKGQCNGCDDCGHNPDFISDKNATCGDCNGDNWFQYPCFLEKACTCSGEPGPSGGPSAGPGDMFEDSVFDFIALV